MKAVVALLGLAMQASAQAPPQILQIYRDRLKPGADAAYREIEEDAARICAALGCPHPYMAIESLTGPKEVWYFNGYTSAAEMKRVGEDYAKNGALMSALDPIPKRKAALVLDPIEAFAEYRQALSRGKPWNMSAGRFLVIAITRSSPRTDATVFETKDGTRFVVTTAQTRAEADAKAAAAGPDANVFAVRPNMSMPAKEWVAADPEFWRSSRSPQAQ